MYSYTLTRTLIMGLMLLIASLCFAEEQLELTLQQAVGQVRQYNPSFAASRQSAQALAFKPSQVDSLPDPVLSLGAGALPTDTFSSTQEGMTQLSVGFSQSFPFPGKLGLAAEAESYMAKAASDESNEWMLQLISKVKISWWNIYYLDRALETVAQNQSLMRQLIQIAQSKYKVGKGLQQDVLLAQLELTKLLDLNIQLDAARSLESSRLNALLNRPAYQDVMLPKTVDEALANIESDEVLVKKALAVRPRLAQQEKLIEAASFRVALADKGNYPDFKLGATYGWRGEDPVTGLDRADLASVSLSMTMPFFTGDKQHAQLQQRQAEQARENFKYADIKNGVIVEITNAATRYNKSKSQVELFKSGMIPQAKQTVASMLAAYQVNKVDFLNLVRAQVTLYNYETQYWKVFAEANQALAQLDAAVGKDVPNE